MDWIRLVNLPFFGRHGVLPEEAVLGQRFEVDVALGLDLRRAGASDDLSATVNYAAVYALVERLVTGTPRKLIEAVAESIAEEILGGFPLVAEVVVVIRKPGAPVPGVFGTISVELTRRR